MKKFLVFICSAMFYSASFAQLAVDTLGKVAIGSMNTASNYALKTYGGTASVIGADVVPVNTMSTGNGQIELKIAMSCSSYTPTLQTESHCGVRGVAFRGQRGYNYGVMGIVDNASRGAAIYGSTNMICKEMSSNMAGFFDGKVQVTQNLTVDGTITADRGVFGYITADTYDGGASTTNEEGQTLSERLADVSVLAATREISIPVESTDDSYEGEPQTTTVERMHYSFEEESICRQFPELVEEDADGQKVVNYMELIPILVKSVSELSKRVQELEAENGKLRKVAAAVSAVNGEMQDATSSYDLSGRQIPAGKKAGLTITEGKKYLAK